ncbi:MAG: hypothetical protein DGJ47_000010 [Rickettsiaceae bacterium]
MSANTPDTISIQEVEEMPVAPPAVESGWLGLMPMVLIFVLFYFLLIRPQEKKRREHEDFVAGVKKGEEIITNSGLFGRVSKINDSDNTIIVEIAKNIEVKMQKNSIADITNRQNKTKEDTPKK